MSFDSDWGGGWSNSTPVANNNNNNNNTNTPAPAVANSNNNTPASSTKNSENEIFSECHSQITKNIQQLSAIFDEIKTNLQYLGKKSDTRKLRDLINEKIGLSQRLLRETQVQLKRLDTIATNSQRQKEKKQKVIKLTQDIESKLNVPFQHLITQARKMMDDIPVPISSAFDNSSDEKNPLLQEEYEQYYKVADETAYQDGIIYEREREIAGIQRQVVEVNEIFRDLGKMISDQSAGIDNIQTHITEVMGNVKTADSEVNEANELSKSGTSKTRFIALGIIVVVVILVIIIVVVLKARNQL